MKWKFEINSESFIQIHINQQSRVSERAKKYTLEENEKELE